MKSSYYDEMAAVKASGALTSLFELAARATFYGPQDGELEPCRQSSASLPTSSKMTAEEMAQRVLKDEMQWLKLRGDLGRCGFLTSVGIGQVLHELVRDRMEEMQKRGELRQPPAGGSSKLAANPWLRRIASGDGVGSGGGTERSISDILNTANNLSMLGDDGAGAEPTALRSSRRSGPGAAGGGTVRPDGPPMPPPAPTPASQPTPALPGRLRSRAHAIDFACRSSRARTRTALDERRARAAARVAPLAGGGGMKEQHLIDQVKEEQELEAQRWSAWNGLGMEEHGDGAGKRTGAFAGQARRMRTAHGGELKGPGAGGGSWFCLSEETKAAKAPSSMNGSGHCGTAAAAAAATPAASENWSSGAAPATTTTQAPSIPGGSGHSGGVAARASSILNRSSHGRPAAPAVGTRTTIPVAVPPSSLLPTQWDARRPKNPPRAVAHAPAPAPELRDGIHRRCVDAPHAALSAKPPAAAAPKKSCLKQSKPASAPPPPSSSSLPTQRDAGIARRSGRQASMEMRPVGAGGDAGAAAGSRLDENDRLFNLLRNASLVREGSKSSVRDESKSNRSLHVDLSLEYAERVESSLPSMPPPPSALRRHGNAPPPEDWRDRMNRGRRDNGGGDRAPTGKEEGEDRGRGDGTSRHGNAPPPEDWRDRMNRGRRDNGGKRAAAEKKEGDDRGRGDGTFSHP